MRVIITGADGFIGAYLCKAFKEKGAQVLACIMGPDPKTALPAGTEVFVTGAIGADTDWRSVLKSGDVVVHLAARVHVMRESAADPILEFRKVNTAGTANLARQAALAGVKRLVFLSTVGVNGNNSGDKIYTENDVPAPHNAYSVSKYEAEQELAKISAETGLEVAVLRAPLVYGPGNPGNFLTLLRLIYKGIPLPFASIANVKSFIYIGNLVEAIILSCAHPAAAGKLYLVSDKEFVSTPDLMQRLAQALGRPAHLFPFPLSLLRLVGKAAGRAAAVDSLLCSLAVDSGLIRRELGWKPPFTLNDGLISTGEWYRARK